MKASSDAMLTVATLGPAESNHELVAGRYLQSIGIDGFRLVLFDDFDVAEKHPHRLRVDTVIGSAQDAWLVHATRSVYRGEVIAWRDGPGPTLLRRIAAAGTRGEAHE